MVDREALEGGQLQDRRRLRPRINKIFDGKLAAVLGDLHDALWQSAG